MPRVFNLYVIAPHRLPADTTNEAAHAEALRAYGARWAQVEGRAVDFLDALDEIGQRIGSPHVRAMVGTITPAEAALLHAALSSAPVDDIDSDARLSEAYWALRDTAEEATQRGASLVIACDG